MIPDDLIGMRVFVYRNLHKYGLNGEPMYSVVCRESARGQYGVVVAWATHVHLTDCSFSVRSAGYDRVMESGVKNVHAGVVGYLAPWTDLPPSFESVSYDPFIARDFMTKSGAPIAVASKLWMASIHDDRWHSHLSAVV